MRAITFEKPGDEGVLTLTDVASPALGAGQIRIRVETTAVNRADLLQRRGLYPPPKGASSILGLECAGRVIECGAGVSSPAVGARVMALLAGGGYAQEVVVEANATLPVPESFSMVEAGVFMETHLTAYLNIFEIGGASTGMTVLVHGGGSGVGTSALALCREAGVRMIVTAGSDEKCARCLELGAFRAINYAQHDFAEAVLEATNREGVEIVLDSIGASYLQRNLACLKTDGRLVVIGLMGGAKGEVDFGRLLTRRLSIHGSTLRSRSAGSKASLIESFSQRFGAALAAGRLRPVVHTSMPLAQAADAHRLVASGTHFGKVALEVA